MEDATLMMHSSLFHVTRTDRLQAGDVWSLAYFQ